MSNARDDGSLSPDELWWHCVEPAWDQIVGQLEDYERPNGVPRTLVCSIALQLVVIEVLNGGLTKFYWNSSGTLLLEASSGFEAIGQMRIAKLLCEGAAYFDIQHLRSTADRRANPRLWREINQGESVKIKQLTDEAIDLLVKRRDEIASAAVYTLYLPPASERSS